MNGECAEAGRKVTGQDNVLVNGKPVQMQEKTVVLAYYKPAGVICTSRDKHAEEKVPERWMGHIRVTYAGRLDKDSEGLLILTNDGDLIDAMMRGANRHEKEYLVKVDRPLSEEALTRMRNGIYLKELDLTTRKCEIHLVGHKTMQMILTQGVNRQIKRMCRETGYRVKKLKRTRVMNIELKDMEPGEIRELTEAESRELYRQCRIETKR